jgi:hypothetical protein
MPSTGCGKVNPEHRQVFQQRRAAQWPCVVRPKSHASGELEHGRLRAGVVAREKRVSRSADQVWTPLDLGAKMVEPLDDGDRLAALHGRDLVRNTRTERMLLRSSVHTGYTFFGIAAALLALGCLAREGLRHGLGAVLPANGLTSVLAFAALDAQLETTHAVLTFSSAGLTLPVAGIALAVGRRLPQASHDKERGSPG